jgi:dienelactone hydrolase
MLRRLVMTGLALVVIDLGASDARQVTYRGVNDRYAAPRYATRDAWSARATYLRAHVLASAGLLPLPDKSPLNPSISDDIVRSDYIVSKVFFESLPGFFVTGNLYRPVGAGPFPAVLSPHGHWTYGRLENTPTTSGPGRAIGLARQGFVVFAYDMIGYLDSQQLPHTFGGRREQLWGLSLAGLQLWNGIRSLDFLESLPYVRRGAIGATGESGGGTQTFLLASVDDRVAAAAPVNMISLHMQGGCLCENPPGLRLDTNNVELAATIAPRPLLMVSATGDWTKETMEVEYPAVRSIYDLFGAGDRVHAVRVDAEHNYNRASREAMYPFMARWLLSAPADARVEERGFTPEPLQDLLVFHRRGLPANAVTASQLTENWIASAKRQLASAPPQSSIAALRHALGFNDPLPPAAQVTGNSRTRTVLLSEPDPALERELRRKELQPVVVRFTAFDDAAAVTIRHFETYNRTAASQRVADIVSALEAHPGAAIVATGDAALAAMIASAVARPSGAVLDVGSFDTSSDAEFLEHLFIPGLRRAGDLQTAARFLPPSTVVHNAGDRFTIERLRREPRKLTPREIAQVLATRAAAQ